jgi:hypothetical protein
MSHPVVVYCVFNNSSIFNRSSPRDRDRDRDLDIDRDRDLDRDADGRIYSKSTITVFLGGSATANRDAVIL